MFQTIFPGQSTRITTGWQISDLPDDTSIHTLPKPTLLDNNVISLPQLYTGYHIGTEITQSIMNNNPYPITIIVK